MKRTWEEIKQWRIENKDKIKEQKRKYREKHKEKIKEGNRIYYLNNPNKYKRNHNIDNNQYLLMFENQNGKCAICGNISNSVLCIDHNHETGKIRALLCSNCNVGLGMFHDDIVLFKKAISYIKKHNEV